MIEVTRINDEKIIVNAAFIEFLEATPDTVISLVSGRKLMVRETLGEVTRRVKVYQREVGLLPQGFIDTDEFPNSEPVWDEEEE